MIFVLLKPKVLGGHVRVQVFATDAPTDDVNEARKATRGKCGDLMFRVGEWDKIVRSLEGVKAVGLAMEIEHEEEDEEAVS